ncbi:FAD-dependent oxidoreductase [Anianabacter salinae]|uniref:FAD-dependent oxidoreductase n=1 Tax=Anianabacter salinae TaxID=2851023 RepID=UPI00225E4924|nr:FAD-dependent oxidoreductase [Anianabacter salinae]MBV0914152.1 FAD-dependent oxidoreductase [Anianabacter salinae]
MAQIHIIGGGITGCVTAMTLADQSHDVTLFEMAPHLGGSLRDFRPDRTSGLWGFRACQYLNPAEPWLADLLEDLDCEMIRFDHTYGSYTVFDGQSHFRDDIALPVLPETGAPLRPYSDPPRTLADRFSAYPDKIAEFLAGTVARCGHASEALSTECAASLQLPAVFIEGDWANMLAAKTADPLTDQLIAMPRAAFGADYADIEAVLPKHGYDPFFDVLAGLLARKGVRLSLSTPVSARRKPDGTGEYGAYINGNWPEADCTVWCCNPVPLVLMSGLGRLSNPASRFVHLHAGLSGLSLEGPRYIQVFDPNSPLYRLYVFPTEFGPRCCLELHAHLLTSVAEARTEAQGILKHIWPGLEIGVPQSDPVSAHYLFSHNDSLLFDALEADLVHQRIIPGAWRVFGRDSKIHAIQSDLEKSGF